MNLLEKSGLDIQSQIDHISKNIIDKDTADSLIANLNQIASSLQSTEYIEVEVVHFSIGKNFESDTWKYAIWCKQSSSEDLLYSESKISYELSKITCQSCRKKVAEFISGRLNNEKRTLRR